MGESCLTKHGGEALGVALGKRSDLVAVGVKDSPASARAIKQGDHKFGLVARIAGNVVLAQLRDVMHENRPTVG